VVVIRQLSQRQRRVARLVQELVASIVRDEVHDPAIGFLTITDAEVSVDMRNATVYYSVLGPDEQIEATSEALRRARKFINVRLGERLAMKYTPQLHFSYDQTAERAQRIEKVLQDNYVESTEQGADPTEDEPA
jgi:ribosome-binding factor A